MAQERTLIIIKPDGVQRHLIGEIISRFERKGFKLVAAKFLRITTAQAQELYSVHKGKSFYQGLVQYLSSSPSLVTVWQGEGIIAMARKMIGATFGPEAQPGTIRGDMVCSRGYNLVHGSDSPESANKEISVFFGADEPTEYYFSDQGWLYGSNE
jgi:nucleoside-diphosphate kinase